ncbi:hypothetical protein Pen02_01120 [Plantactinospora endophytica]|uniref:Ig-like domain-containing protein n=1 Tax=Plantactinospora endophytica TaxID=673535 RepID=A0ABQ4DRV5_9ACTN|nr:hypothetical protein Pen02_01120 [Plantactinospora endophytica]
MPPGYPGPPGYPIPPVPPGYPVPPGAAGYPATGAVAPSKKRRGLVIASVALVGVLLLCVVGGVSAFLVLRGAERGAGATDPVVAVDEFLTAVYTERDADRATGLVCPAARDGEQIAAKIQEVADSAGRYDTARFRWTTPKVDEQDKERALVSTRLTMTTADERSVDQQLAFVVVADSGWWVCDVI